MQPMSRSSKYEAKTDLNEAFGHLKTYLGRLPGYSAQRGMNVVAARQSQSASKLLTANAGALIIQDLYARYHNWTAYRIYN